MMGKCMLVNLLLLLSASSIFCVNVDLLKPYSSTATAMYHETDTDHDGIFTLQELIAEFDQYNINHDGYISRHEYTAYICFLQPAMYHLSHYLFDQYDISPVDHKLEMSDFVKFYAKLDANGDGTVDEAEWVTWWVQTFQSLEGANYHQHGHSAEHGSVHCM